jgi:sulfite reductase alpha subunit-like flavoprotein
MAKDINDDKLYYEIVLSKGKGKLTRNAEQMLILIGTKIITKKERSYRSIDDRNDCLQQGLFMMFQNWKNFNEKRYKKALPYFTEIFKRAMAQGLKDIYNIKNNKDKVTMISLDSSNDGQGLHNI